VGDVIREISGVSVENEREKALELIRKGGKQTVKFERYIGRRVSCTSNNNNKKKNNSSCKENTFKF
jgi:general stress protein YciG